MWLWVFANQVCHYSLCSMDLHKSLFINSHDSNICYLKCGSLLNESSTFLEKYLCSIFGNQNLGHSSTVNINVGHILQDMKYYWGVGDNIYI